MLNKIFTTLDKSVADIPDGATIMIGGFGDVGMPFGLIEALMILFKQPILSIGIVTSERCFELYILSGILLIH